MIVPAARTRPPRSATPPRKSASGSFRSRSHRSTWKNRPQSQSPRRKTRPTPTTTAAGAPVHSYRYYEPLTGKWLNRDLIEERSGLYLYEVVWNDVVNKCDTLGLAEAERVKVWDGLFLEILGAAFKNSRNEFGVGLEGEAEYDEENGHRFVGKPDTPRVFNSRSGWSQSLDSSAGPTKARKFDPNAGCDIECYSWEKAVAFSQAVRVPGTNITLGDVWAVTVKVEMFANGDVSKASDAVTLKEDLGKNSFRAVVLRKPGD